MQLKKGRGRKESLQQVFEFVCAASFIPALAIIGTPVEPWLSELWQPAAFALNRFYEGDTIPSLWGAVLALHAAFAAIAPILGYTLLTSAAAPLSRYAPAGFVVAEAIQWRAYLLEVIGLLAGSLVAFATARSAIGCLAATAAACYVLFFTYRVFKQGFQLLQNEPQFDHEARAYLRRAIVEVTKPKLASDIESRRLEFSTWLGGLNSPDWSRRGRYSVLAIGLRDKPSELLKLRGGAAKRLESVAAENGIELRVGDFKDLPVVLGAGRHPLIVAVPAAPEAVQVDGSRPNPDDERLVDERFSSVQEALDDLVQFGDGKWAESQQRVPLLILGHLAVTLNESLNRKVVHDLKAALNALGDLVDEVTQKDVDGSILKSDPYRWVYDIPASLTKRMCAENFGDQNFEIALVAYLRGRLRNWLGLDRYETLARAYLDLLVELIVGVIASRRKVDDLLMYVREIPALSEDKTGRAAQLVCRAILLAFLDPRVADADLASARARLVITLHDAVAYASVAEAAADALQLQVAVHSTAATLFLASRDERYRSHVVELLQSRLLEVNEAGEKTIALIRIADEADTQVDNWRWDWWELEIKGDEEAHFMSMSHWLTKSVGLVLAQSPWSLRALADSEVPSLDVLGRLQRAISEPDWLQLIGENGRTIPSLVEELGRLTARRKAMVQAGISAAALDADKMLRFVEQVASDLSVTHAQFARWLLDVGVSGLSDDPMSDRKAGVSQLLKRELFVADEHLDISSIVLPPSVGRSLVSFEIRSMAETVLASSAPVTRVPSTEDERIWEYVNGQVRAGVPLLVIGHGVSLHQVWRQIEEAKALSQQTGTVFRYEGFRSPEFRGTPSIVVITTDAIRITRFPLRDPDPGTHRALDTADGGAVVSLRPPTEVEIERWTTDDPKSTESAERYRDSVLFRVLWSFLVEMRNAERARVFVLTKPRTKKRKIKK